MYQEMRHNFRSKLTILISIHSGKYINYHFFHKIIKIFNNSFYSPGENIALTTIYYNVSVDVKSQDLSFSRRGKLNTSEDCIHNCQMREMDCFGSLFDNTANMCHFYVQALNGDFHTKHTFLVQTSTSETTFYYKSWQRRK